jgi:hypothetical protein
MEPERTLDQLRADFKAAWGTLEPYLQRSLTQEENARRTSIIREGLLPVVNEINEIESVLDHA